MRDRQIEFVRKLLTLATACVFVLPWASGCQGVPLTSARFNNAEQAVAFEPTLAQAPSFAEKVRTEKVPEPHEVLEPVMADPAPVPPSDPPLPIPDPDTEPIAEPVVKAVVASILAPVVEDASETVLPAEQSPSSPASEETHSAPAPLRHTVPSAIPSERFLQPPTHSQRHTASCDEDITALPATNCRSGVCPPLFALPQTRLRSYMGPLFYRNAPYDEDAMAEAELQPPFARFHPVPPAPVFAPHPDYAPPQLMMVPVKQPHHLPGPFAPNSEPTTQLLLPGDEVSQPVAPADDMVQRTSTVTRAPAVNWRATTIHKHRQ